MKKPFYIIVAAMAENRVIGKDGKLPWYLPEDFQNFKQLTLGGIIVMGRKTYESIGRPLPGRRNIVLSSQEKKIDGVEVLHTIEQLMQVFQEEGIDRVFIIGGQGIYKEFLNRKLIDEVWLSKIPGNYEGDTFLQPFEENFIENENIPFETFQFVTYRRRGEKL